MSKAKGAIAPSPIDPFEELARELGMIPRKLNTMKSVFHLMYADYRFDLDTEFQSIDEIVPFLEAISKQGIKPQPAFVKQGDKPKVEGTVGTIMFVDAGKTKNDKECFFVRIKPDNAPDDMKKSDMVEIMQMPITKGKKTVCMWEVGDHVVVIKNDKGFLDIDDATDLTDDMTDDEKKTD